MPKKTVFVALILSLAIVLLAGFSCQRENRAVDEKSNAPARANFQTEFPIALGKKQLNLRLALTDLERQQGLTGCRGLADGAGMLFVYADAAPRAFWMRGVPTDLSIGFFDASGALLETREMRTQDLSMTHSQSGNVKFVLEMAPRWFERNGIPAGATLDLHALSAALRSRGFSSERFRLFQED